MSYKKFLLSGLIIFFILNPLFAVSTTQIDVVRNKEAIADADATIIAEFLKDAFDEFLSKTDFSDIAVLRNVIITKGTSANTTGQILYGPKYAAAFQKQLADAFTKVNAMPQGRPKTLLTMNLLILTSDMANIEASKTALNYLQNPTVIIRYWAANNFTGSAMLKQLNEGPQSTRTEIIGKILKASETETSPEVLNSFCQFAAGLKDPASNDILTSIAQKRIDLYLAWKANDELTDEGILKSLADKVKTDPNSIKVMAKSFATLFSVIIQKYALGDQTLSEMSKANLAAVISSADKYVTAFIGDWTGNFKKALDKGPAALLGESEALFGSASTPGKMPTALGFDYGKNADGSAKMFPQALAKPKAK